MRYILFVLFISLFIGSCVNAPEYPIEPVIKFEGLSKPSMLQGKLNEDTIFIQFSFTDGDGDLGGGDHPNAFLIDQRDSFAGQTYVLPFVPEEGAGNGITGIVDLKLYTTCCIFTDGTAPCGVSPTKAQDTLYYTLYIEDRAGHKSNEVQVGPLYLRCQ